MSSWFPFFDVTNRLYANSKIEIKVKVKSGRWKQAFFAYLKTFFLFRNLLNLVVILYVQCILYIVHTILCNRYCYTLCNFLNFNPQPETQQVHTPPIYLHLIFEICSLKYPVLKVLRTGYLVYFQLELYRLQHAEKSSNWIFQTGHFKNQVQIDRRTIYIHTYQKALND